MFELKTKEVNGIKKTLSLVAFVNGLCLLSETSEGKHTLKDGTTCYYTASARCLQPKDAEEYFRNW